MALRIIAVIALVILSAIAYTFFVREREALRKEQEKQVEEQRRMFIEGP